MTCDLNKKPIGGKESAIVGLRNDIRNLRDRIAVLERQVKSLINKGASK